MSGSGKFPGTGITKVLEDSEKLVVGSEIRDYKDTLRNVKESLRSETDVRGQQTYDLRTGVHVVTGIEAPLLDLLGKYLGLPVASSLGKASNVTK